MLNVAKAMKALDGKKIFLYYWQAWTSLPFFLPLFWVIQLADLKSAPLGSLYVSPGWL